MITKQTLLTVVLLFSVNQGLATSKHERHAGNHLYLNVSLVKALKSKSINQLTEVKELVRLGASTRFKIRGLDLVSYLTQQIDQQEADIRGLYPLDPTAHLEILSVMQSTRDYLVEHNEQEDRWMLKSRGDWVTACVLLQK